MKRLVGVLILASVPIACGTNTPSAPDASWPTSDSGTVASLARGRVPAPQPICTPGDRSHLKSIELMVVAEGEGFATLRAIARDWAGNDVYPPVCLEPSWIVSPKAATDVSRAEQVTVYGSGKYEVTAISVLTRNGRQLRASVTIGID
jgi:hypothetical protein